MTTKGTATVTLPAPTQLLITREFDAPRQLVYQAWTTPELIKRWWAGDRGVVTVAEVDLRVGGAWRYAMTANPGFEVAFHGEFREIVTDERIVSTEIFEGMPDAGASMNTLTLIEHDGSHDPDRPRRIPQPGDSRPGAAKRHGSRHAACVRLPRGGRQHPPLITAVPRWRAARVERLG